MSATLVAERSDLQRRYLALRSVYERIRDRALYDAADDVLDYFAERLGLFDPDGGVDDSEIGMSLLCDFALFEPCRKTPPLILSYLDRHRPLDQTERRVHEAIRHARCSAFEIVVVRPDIGVEVRDALSGGDFLLADIGLSRTAAPSLAVFGRVLPVADFAISACALLPLVGMVGAFVAREVHRLERTNPGLEFHSTTTRLAIVRAALAAGVDEMMDARGPEDWPAPSAPSAPPRVARAGRNDLCPCGSGLKFKRCCGRG